MSELICTEDKKDCPYRVFDIKKNSLICTFSEKYWDKFHNYGYAEANVLIKKACEKIKIYELHQMHVSKLHTKDTMKMLNNIAIGDVLFWLSRNEEVTLVEEPSEINVLARCKCQRYNNEILNIPARLLRQFSKDNFLGEYLIDNYEDNKEKARELEYWAKSYGFRAEIVEIDNGYMLRIYGNSQNEVDDFINLFITQNRQIF